MRTAGRGRRSREDREPARHRACSGEPAAGGTGVGDRRGDPHLRPRCRAPRRPRAHRHRNHRGGGDTAVAAVGPGRLPSRARRGGRLHDDQVRRACRSRRPVAVGRSRGLADLAAGGLLSPQGHPSADAHTPGLCPGGAAAGGVRGLSAAPARRQPALACPPRSRVPVRAGLPVGVRSRVPAGPSQDPAR